MFKINKSINQSNNKSTDIDPPDDWLKTGWAPDSQTRTRLVDSLIFITCSLENNAFSGLHYVMVALHYSMLHRFEIFSALGTIAHGSIRLPPRSLASSRGCEAAIFLVQGFCPLKVKIIQFPSIFLIRTGSGLQRHSVSLAWRLDREMRRRLILHETKRIYSLNVFYFLLYRRRYFLLVSELI